MNKCIWCKKLHSTTDKEHIIPEPLGCPPEFILSKGEVCKKCNNSLAHLDQAVINDFDFLTFMNGIPRKNNKTPRVSSRGNVVAYCKDQENIIYFNMSKTESRTTDGFYVSPHRKAGRNIDAKFQGNKVSFQITFGSDPKFGRGILKIAFSSIVYFLGREMFLGAEYDSVRRFVCEGKGERKIILIPSQDQKYRNTVKPLVLNKNADGYGILLRIGMINFLVDLTPEMRHFSLLKDKATSLWGKDGWSYLPLDKKETNNISVN